MLIYYFKVLRESLTKTIIDHLNIFFLLLYHQLFASFCDFYLTTLFIPHFILNIRFSFLCVFTFLRISRFGLILSNMPRAANNKATSSSQSTRVKPSALAKTSQSLKGRRQQCEDDTFIDDDLSDDDDVSLSGSGSGLTCCQKGLNTAVVVKLLDRIADLLHSHNDLMTEIRDLRQDYRKVTENYEHLLNRMEIMENMKETHNANVNGKHMVASPGNVDSLTTNVADELVGRREKEMNLVLLGYEKLSDSESSEEEERTAATGFIQTQLAIADPGLLNAARLGRRQPGRSRPLRVTFSSSGTRLSTLNAAKNLSKLPRTNKYRSVFVRPDLTKLQREQDYLRRQARRSAGAGRSAPLPSDRPQPL